ncbi:hypothetical protein AZE42_10925 [Rhizopogon vesiculosus]|uniref:Uncharacterized protein n=1 Tax=Rhizopogon vesiculosus TaxID=180088 RepID=A0A1J8QJD3_9AGAM|nr:hypothetical protein AZE42_10925 [Rhizopogon vesiculosus]
MHTITEILLLLLYPAIKKDGWGINNRFMRGLIQHNLLYFGCSFAFILSVILTLVFLPFPVTHIIEECVAILTFEEGRLLIRQQLSGHSSECFGYPNAQGLLEIGSRFLRH